MPNMDLVDTPRRSELLRQADEYTDPTTRRMLRAAVDLAAKTGIASIEQVTVEQLVRKAKVSNSTVYKVMPSGKKSLVHAVTNFCWTELDRIVSAAEFAEPLADPIANMVRIYRVLSELRFTEDQNLVTVALTAVRRADLLNPDDLPPALSMFTEHTQRWCSLAIESGLAHPGADARSLSTSVFLEFAATWGMWLALEGEDPDIAFRMTRTVDELAAIVESRMRTGSARA